MGNRTLLRCRDFEAPFQIEALHSIQRGHAGAALASHTSKSAVIQTTLSLVVLVPRRQPPYSCPARQPRQQWVKDKFVAGRERAGQGSRHFDALTRQIT